MAKKKTPEEEAAFQSNKAGKRLTVKSMTGKMPEPVLPHDPKRAQGFTHYILLDNGKRRYLNM